MSLTREVMQPSPFSVQLRGDTPPSISNLLRVRNAAFQSVVFTRAWIDSTQLDPATILAHSVYTGILLQLTDLLQVEGTHVTGWLADRDNKGVLDEVGSLSSAAARSFSTWVNGIRPPTLSAGTINTVSGTQTWAYGWAVDQNYDPRSALNAICDLFTPANAPGVEWEVTNDLKLNAGKITDLYAGGMPNVPPIMLTEFDQGREGGSLRAIPCTMSVTEDVTEYTTRVLVKDVSGGLGAYGPASTPPYYDGRGNTIAMKRRVDGVEATFGSLNTVAQGQYNRLTGLTNVITVRTRHWCPLAEIRVGQYVYVWAPTLGLTLPQAFYDVPYQGEVTWPLGQTRVLSMTQPVAAGMGVYLRYYDGSAFQVVDLTPWVEFEDGETSIEIGALKSKLSATARQGSRGIRGVA